MSNIKILYAPIFTSMSNGKGGGGGDGGPKFSPLHVLIILGGAFVLKRFVSRNQK